MIEIEHVTKAFGEFAAISDISLVIPEGALVALLGPSGSGKTTLLRVIAGLEQAQAGRVKLAGVDVTDAPVQRRGIGFVFQDYALFEHMSVADNIAFGLAVRRESAQRIDARVRELLDLVQLADVGARAPRELSGGQRQRVALARALAPRPRVLLLDEPFGALDARVRAELRVWLRRLHDDLHVTSVFVTHDQDEALEVADQLVVLDRGRIEQVGTPADVLAHPASPFVADFLGGTHLLHGDVRDGVGTFGALALPTTGSGSARAFVRVVLDHST
jgi:sulfate transport system ATP-binding protein